MPYPEVRLSPSTTIRGAVERSRAAAGTGTAQRSTTRREGISNMEEGPATWNPTLQCTNAV
jgi:hypothetical protein